MSDYQDIDFQQTREILDREKDSVLLDVREEEEFITGHPIEAELLPLSTLGPATAAELIPSKDSPALVYCRSGVRSRSADHLQTERAQLETERERIEQMKLSLYPDWKAGDISREEYHRLKAQFEQQQGKLDTRIAALQTRIDEAQNGVDETNSFLSQFIKYRNLQTLTREVIVELIDMIYVHEGGKITIKFKFSDAYAAVQDYIRKHGKTA